MRDVKEWHESGIEPIAEGVFRITLPLPHDSLRAVNVYALIDEQGIVLIDAGWAIREAQDALERSLGDVGHSLSDVTRILVTHVHRDHLSLALTLRRLYGAQIALGIGEQPSLEELRAGRHDGPFRLLGRWGAAELAAEMQPGLGRGPEAESYDPPDLWIDGPATLTVAGRRLLAMPTPGHTNGHVVFADLAEGLLFAGDHVLPRITPSIGYEPVRQRQPLMAYLASLQQVLDLPDLRLLPAHGPVAASSHRRAAELVAHHEHRLLETLAAMGDGRSTVLQVASRLGWTKSDRDFGDLDLLNRALAVSETAAHLDLLVARGLLDQRTVDGVDQYGDPAAIPRS
ncbi:MBL fold metallo-hydrolase [Nocardioides humi]|uniref:MBL fold metallo-hydrolase n=1 Tax=Nocardioides humi TaxID=449461 RepID=A0ABN1ZWM0_9ACTN|nr:MBL fold metallo-hydrolase [Nocardioides humi]